MSEVTGPALVLIDEVVDEMFIWRMLDGLRAGVKVERGDRTYRVIRLKIEAMNPWQWRVVVEGLRME